MLKNLKPVSLILLFGAISLGLTSCQKEDFINSTNSPSAAFSLNKKSLVKAQSIALTATENFSIYDFGYGSCKVSKNGNTIAISNFKADCTIGPFTITPDSTSEPWTLTYSYDDGIIAVNEYNSSVGSSHLLGIGTTNYGTRTFYLHISKLFFRSGTLSVRYKNAPSIKSELIFNRL